MISFAETTCMILLHASVASSSPPGGDGGSRARLSELSPTNITYPGLVVLIGLPLTTLWKLPASFTDNVVAVDDKLDVNVVAGISETTFFNSTLFALLCIP